MLGCGARRADGCTPGDAGYCPIDAIELGPDCEVDLPHEGTITNFSIVTPVQYPGQTETEPFVRAFVLLDGTDVIVPYSAVIELPADQVRVGQRVERRVGLPGREDRRGWRHGGRWGSLLGWIPNGEPDVDDPDLVNRIF